MTFSVLDPVSSHFFRNAGQQGPIMLMYHSVERDVGAVKWPWSISIKLFKDHLDLLCDHGWKARTMAEIVQTPIECLAPKTIVITFDDGFENNLQAVDALIERGMLATWFIVTGAIGQVPHWKDSGRPEDRILDASSLRNMRDAGMEIGSHSVNHRKLPSLTDPELTLELAQSKNTLEDILGSPVKSFAYPYGIWDERSETAVSRSGYRFACTTQTGAALKDNHPLRLRRLAIFNHDSAAALARKLTLIANDGGLAKMIFYYSRRAAHRLWPGTAV